MLLLILASPLLFCLQHNALFRFWLPAVENGAGKKYPWAAMLLWVDAVAALRRNVTGSLKSFLPMPKSSITAVMDDSLRNSGRELCLTITGLKR